MPIDAKTAVEVSYKEWLLGEEEARQAAVEDRLLMYRDAWLDVLRERINARVSDKSKSKMLNYARLYLNPMKSIIGQVADIYTEPPSRKFDGPQEELFQELYERIEIDEIMKLSNQYLHVVNDPILYVSRRENDDGELQTEVDILAGSVVTVFTDNENPTKPIKVMIKRRWDSSKGFTPDNRYWVVWTKDEHYILDGQFTQRPIEGNEGMVNPWGKLPFVFMHKSYPDASFWNNTEGGNLYELTVLVNICMVMDDLTRFHSGFKQPAVTGTNIQALAGISKNPDEMLVIQGNDVTLQTIDYQVDYDKLTADIREKVALVQAEYGIDASQYSGRASEAGISMFIRQSQLQNNRQKQQGILIKAEQQLFELIKLIEAKANNHNPDDTTMEVSYAKAKIYIDPKIELEIQEKEIDLDLADKVEVFIQRNPDFKGDYEAAKKRLIEIHESNNEFREKQDKPIMKGLNPFRKEPGEIPDESLDEEKGEKDEART